MTKVHATEKITDRDSIRETIKKSSLAAEDTFDYLKLTKDVQGLIPVLLKNPWRRLHLYMM